jgi:hypothetical protein
MRVCWHQRMCKNVLTFVVTFTPKHTPSTGTETAAAVVTKTGTADKYVYEFGADGFTKGTVCILLRADAGHLQPRHLPCHVSCFDT